MTSAFLETSATMGWKASLSQNLVPVSEVAEQERHVHQRRGLGEGRHVRRRNHGVVDRYALAQVREVVLLGAEFAVPVQHEIDWLAVVLLDQLFEFQQCLVERMFIGELHRAMQGEGFRGCSERKGECCEYDQRECNASLHGSLLLDAPAC
jgi:hypothetical protein